MVDTQMLRANNKPEALNAMIERKVLRRIGKADEIAAEADLVSGSWVEIVHRRTRAKRFRIRSEPAPYRALHRSLWESTCGSIIEAAATSASG